MEAAARSIAAYFDLMMQEGLAQQTFRFRERWEPCVTGLLCNAADAASHKLRPLLAEYVLSEQNAAYCGAVKAGITEIVTSVLEAQVQSAQEMLLKMVSYETNQLLETLTLGGLAGQAGSLDLRTWEDQDMARQLAGGNDLGQAADKSAREFIQRVEAAFRIAQEEDGEAALKALEQAVQWWRGRLSTIANT
ncbi:MAG: hypothetical protein KJ921_13075, partial [Proteobacteria bacterium]|nr:hypothetical protein [Pseudomonadota bacterium]